jgi:hypothetical protein
MIAKPEAANAAANALLADSVEPSVLAMAIDGADLGKRMDDAFRRSRRMAEVSDASAALETKLESGRQILARKIERKPVARARRIVVGARDLGYARIVVTDAQGRARNRPPHRAVAHQLGNRKHLGMQSRGGGGVALGRPPTARLPLAIEKDN